MNDLLQMGHVWFRMSEWMFLWFKSDDCVANFLGHLSQTNVFGLTTGSLFALFGTNVTASPVTWRENSTVSEGRFPLSNNEMLDSGSGSISIGSMDWTGTGILGFGAGMLMGFGRGIWIGGKKDDIPGSGARWLMWWLFCCIVVGVDSVWSNVTLLRDGSAFKWLSSSTLESWSLKGSNEMTIFSVSFRFRDVLTNWVSSSLLNWIFSCIRICLVRLVFREKNLLQILQRNGPANEILFIYKRHERKLYVETYVFRCARLNAYASPIVSQISCDTVYIGTASDHDIL